MIVHSTAGRSKLIFKIVFLLPQWLSDQPYHCHFIDSENISTYHRLLHQFESQPTDHELAEEQHVVLIVVVDGLWDPNRGPLTTFK